MLIGAECTSQYSANFSQNCTRSYTVIPLHVHIRMNCLIAVLAFQFEMDCLNAAAATCLNTDIKNPIFQITTSSLHHHFSISIISPKRAFENEFSLMCNRSFACFLLYLYAFPCSRRSIIFFILWIFIVLTSLIPKQSVAISFSNSSVYN